MMIEHTCLIHLLFGIFLFSHSCLAISSSDTHSIDLSLTIAPPGTNRINHSSHQASSERTHSAVLDDVEVTQKILLKRKRESMAGADNLVRISNTVFLFVTDMLTYTE